MQTYEAETYDPLFGASSQRRVMVHIFRLISEGRPEYHNSTAQFFGLRVEAHCDSGTAGASAGTAPLAAPSIILHRLLTAGPRRV